MTVAPEVEAYLAALQPDRRARLESMRSVVLGEAPALEERISYGIPTYRLDGRMLVSIASFAKHDSLFPASREVRDRLGPRIEPYVHGRGTFRFQARDPLPLDLIRQIVQARVEEMTADPRP
jgi:uncharacterized protein YdhG (YjbR/CyaY superfamily)